MTEESKSTNDPGGQPLDDSHYDLYDDELRQVLESGIDQKVEDDPAASRSLYHYRTLDKEIGRIAELARARLDDINRWQLERITALRKAQQFFIGPLECYMRRMNEDNKKRKSIKYPEGTIGLRKLQPELIVNPDHETPDDDFIKAHPDLVKIKHNYDRTAIKKAITEDGEEVAHFGIEDRDPKFYIKLSEEG